MEVAVLTTIDRFNCIECITLARPNESVVAHTLTCPIYGVLKI